MPTTNSTPAYNVHSHIFTMNNAPERFLHLYLPDLAADLVDTITNTSAGSRALSSLLSLPLFGAGGKRYASFLKIGKSKNQLEVFENLMQQYNNQQMRFVALSMYMEKCGAGSSLSGFEGQLEELISIKKQYPERLHLFLGIDPRWKLNGQQLRQTVEAYFELKIKGGNGEDISPFTGLKLYPSMGFYAFDENLKDTFEWAADKGVPVLSHCYYRGGIYCNDENYLRNNLDVYDPYTKSYYKTRGYISQKKIGKWLLGRNTSYNNLNTCSYFLEPHSYESLIKYFSARPKPLKLCFAHYGGSEMMRIKNGTKTADSEEAACYGVENRNWYEQVKDLLKYPGVYTDIAYTLVDPKVHSVIMNDLNDAVTGGKILYGTDYFLAERDMPEKTIYENFKNVAINKTLSNFNDEIAWDRIAKNNVYDFLESVYQPRPTLIS